MLFDLRLPSIDTWRFDFDAEGWTEGGLSDLKAVWGAVTFTTTSADPQITSPITYLDCRLYPRIRVRMRAMPVDGRPKSATGQVFWSTVDKRMDEAASASFAVPLDGLWHVHEIELRGNPNWTGRTDRIRLDPVDAAGVRVEVDEIGFVRSGN